MLYFAYGSNMDWEQMWKRCPSARFAGIAVLPNHRLAFTRKSVKRGCGVADAVERDGGKVWGVVYDIDDLDVGRLDASEGYRPGRARNSYLREERHVYGDGNDQQPLAVSTYFAERQVNPPLPNAEYKRLLGSGSKHWHLPDEYVRQLEAIEVRD